MAPPPAKPDSTTSLPAAVKRAEPPVRHRHTRLESFPRHRGAQWLPYRCDNGAQLRRRRPMSASRQSVLPPLAGQDSCVSESADGEATRGTGPTGGSLPPTTPTSASTPVPSTAALVVQQVAGGHVCGDMKHRGGAAGMVHGPVGGLRRGSPPRHTDLPRFPRSRGMKRDDDDRADVAGAGVTTTLTGHWCTGGGGQQLA